MASSKDFVANQIRTAKVIMTGSQPGDGGIGVGNIGLSIYDQSIALNSEGGVSDGNLYAGAGSEVKVFISGSANYKGRDAGNSHVLFGGNLSTSGSMHFMNPALAQASVTITSSGSPNNGQALTLIATDGTSVTLTLTADGTDATGGGGSASNIHFARNGSSTHSLAELKALIEAHPTLSGDFTVSSVTTSGSNKVITILQIGAGSAGNTAITNNLNTYNLGGGAGANSAFSGGIGPTSTFIFSDSERENHLYLSGTFFASGSSDATPYGTISGSIHHTRDGLSYLVAGSNITIASASNGQVTITAAAGGGDDGMGSGFVLEDDDGTEVSITEFKEVKFIGAGGIVTNWTDVSNGTDGDPYDLTFTAADLTFAGDGGSSQALTLGDTFTIAGGTNVTTAMTSDTVTITATDTNTMGAGFVIEDDSGDEVTITESQEVKIIGAGGITTNWTDVSPGSDADPYDLTITAANLTVAGDSGSTAMTLGDTLTIAGGTNCSTAMSGDTLTINATGGTADGMGSGFVLEDDDGTEVTITENKEVKIIGAGGIVTNWTDVSNGTDADPYDLTITGPPVEYVFSHDGPNQYFKTVVGIKDDVVNATAESSASPDGTAMGFLHNTSNENAEVNAVAFRVTVPTGYVAASTTINFKVLASNTAPPGGSDKIELRIAGRHKETTGSPAYSNITNDTSTRGKWSDETGRDTGTTSGKAPDGWFYFTNAAGIAIPNNDFIIDSQTFLLADIVNTAGSMQAGDIIDICLARNRGNDNAGQIGGVATSDDYGNKLLIYWTQVTITP